MTGTHQRGRAKSTAQSDPKTLEFVPKGELDRALEEVQRLRENHERLQREIERLQKEWEEARRGLKRQTAPFSRRKRKADPRSNGRKSGAAHGQHHRRAIPVSVDEQYLALAAISSRYARALFLWRPCRQGRDQASIARGHRPPEDRAAV
jgi:chromosome segregation ATPase